MTPQRAEEIAIAALTWLVGNDELFQVFSGASGLDAGQIRAQAENRHFLASVLEFITMDDAWVIAFCDAEGLKYDQPLTALRTLPGAEAVHWT